MNTRFYLVRTAANQDPGAPPGRVDSGYADGSHQLAFAQLDSNGNVIPGSGLAGLMYYAIQNGELVYQVFTDAEAQEILTMYKQTGTAPAGIPPVLPLAANTGGLSSIPIWAWAIVAYLVLS